MFSLHFVKYKPHIRVGGRGVAVVHIYFSDAELFKRHVGYLKHRLNRALLDFIPNKSKYGRKQH